MRVIIAGSRHCNDIVIVKLSIATSPFEISEVVSGCAKGVDTLGESWAERNGIPVARFPAQWDVYGKAAGPIRNGQMAEYGDALVAVLYPGSRGTLNMIKQMRNKRKPVHVHYAVRQPVEKPDNVRVRRGRGYTREIKK